ncbi:unnamed protein product [Malus baccata var. baccata]
MVEKVVSENRKQLEQCRGGKTKLQGYFAGQYQSPLLLLDLRSFPASATQDSCFDYLYNRQLKV